MTQIIQIEQTPNPDALKFVTDQVLVPMGSKSFDSSASAGEDQLARALFQLDGVQSVFEMDRFVTVTKTPEQSWAGLQDKVTVLIQSNAVPNGGDEKVTGPRSRDSSEQTDDVLAKINQVLDVNIRPALAGDGGGLEILGYQDFVLSVHYQGACGSCPSSTAGTLVAIQNLLQRMVDSRIQVMSD